jgi:spore coat protein U-like protein
VLRAPESLNFGSYGPENLKGEALKGAADVFTIACTKNTPGVKIALNNGRHFNHGRRHLEHFRGKAHVIYQIYTNARRNVVWNETNTVAYIARSGQPTAITMYGKVPGDQKVIAGEYSDTLTATVNF